MKKIMKKILMVAIALLFIISTLFSTQNANAQETTAFVGLIVDTGGLDDNGLNEMAYQGLLDAQNDLGISPNTYEVVTEEDYLGKLNACVTDGNDICIALTWQFADEIAAVAAANPMVKFALIDSTLGEPYPANFRSVEFKIKEAGYLAGALAGKMTGTDIIGTVGGMDIPPVTGFMQGYKNGAECANSNVIVLSQYANNFGDPAVGAAVAKDLIAKGSDVIFSVAGFAGFGSSWYATKNGKFAIGVDADAYYTAFGEGTVEGSDMLLSSAIKRYDVAVYKTIEDHIYEAVWTGAFSYGLIHSGVSLAPFHETDSLVSLDVRNYLAEVEQDIKDGDISVDDTCTLTTPSAKVGLVVDVEALKDNPGWSGLAYQGLIRAHADLGILPAVYEGSDDFATKVQACIDGGNDLCIGNSFLLTDDIAAAAAANPTISFANIDSIYETPPGNLRGISFRAKEAAYLAGALASKMSASHKMGVVGGPSSIQPVVDLVEGYQNGAQCTSPYSLVLTTYLPVFNNPTLGAETAEDMITQGADTIFSAAGPTGDGAILYSAQHDKWSIGVDSDEYSTVFEGGTVDGSDMLLSSAMKRLDNTVYDSVEDFLGTGTFGGNVEYGLLEGGVGLAPYHETDDDVSVAIKSFIETLKSKIVSGTVSVDVTCFLPAPFPKNSPAKGAINQPANPTLKWAASNYSSSYEYCIDKLNDNKCTTGWKSVGKSTSKALSGLTAGTYYWQVRARNARATTNANNGTWWWFTVPVKPGAFGKLTPTNGSVNQPVSLTLTWGASANAAKYEYCIKTTVSGACTWKTVGTAKKVYLTGLLRNTKYYWQVRAVNAMGTTVANGGALWNFTTKP